MTPARHREIKQAFLAVYDCPESERADRIAELCRGDAELQRELEKLLAQASAADATRPMADHDPESAQPQIGDIFAGRYQILDRVGAGGMGEVYRALDRILDQVVALKLLRPDADHSEAWLLRFQGEVRIAREITHPNVCRVFDIGYAGAQCFFSMEYVEGEDLAVLLRRAGRLSPERGREVGQEICRALAALHAKGILHRDLKPTNILLDRSGGVHLGDFGLATRDLPRGSELFAGTPAYMAPEQIAGRGVSEASDLYSLGLILFEIFTGRSALVGSTLREWRDAHQFAIPPSPAEIVPELDDDVVRTIQRCLEKKPENRPPSAIAALAMLGGDPLAEVIRRGDVPSPDLVANARFDDRRPWPALAGACVVLMALVAAATSLWIQRVADVSDAIPVAVLKFRADTLADHLGRRADQRRAHGLDRSVSVEPFVTDAEPWVLAARSGGPLLWLRTSTQSLAPIGAFNNLLGGGRATWDDPPTAPRSMRLLVDADGQLVAFSRDALQSAHEGVAFSADDCLRAAGLAVERLEEAAPRLRPAVPVDAQRAWTSRDGDTIRAEYASLNGQPAFFAVVRDGAGASAAPGTPDAIGARGTLLLVLLIIAFPLARRNVLSGQADTRGATRLATVVLGCAMFRWLLGATHPMTISAELMQFGGAVLGACGLSAVVMGYYLALEPLIRRYWPQTMVAWNKALLGRLLDPTVGREVLLGMIAGAWIAMLYAILPFIDARFGLAPGHWAPPHDVLQSLLGAQFVAAEMIRLFVRALYDAVTFLLVVAIARVIVRVDWAAALLATGVTTLVFLPFATAAWQSIVVAAVFGAGVMAFVTIRYGLVATSAALFTSAALRVFVGASIPANWQGMSRISGFALVAVCAMIAVYAARRHPRRTYAVRA